MAVTQTCTSCSREFPATREFFGNTPSGGFRRKCRQCMASHTAAHYAANPEQAAARRSTRQAREANAGAKYTPEQIATLRQHQKDKCGYCLEPLGGGGQVDHMVPVAKGGTNALANLVIACQQCNKEKHAKTAHEYFWWRHERGLPNYASAFAYRAIYGSRKCVP